MSIPEKIKNSSGEVFVFSSRSPLDGLFYYRGLDYRYQKLTPSQIEVDFIKDGRAKPHSLIQNQEQWDCGPTCLAMLLKFPLNVVRKAAFKSGWKNDSTGITSAQLIHTGTILGKILTKCDPKNEDNLEIPQILTVESLNYVGHTHAVFWNGKELLDPNWGLINRKWWGCEWSPLTIPTIGPSLFLSDNFGD